MFIISTPQDWRKASSLEIPSLATRRKKTRRMRGSRLHGWGVSGQHRDSGSQGGRGKAGTFKHRKSKVQRYGEMVGAHGFTSHPLNVSRAINVGDLERIISSSTEVNHGNKAENSIDLGKLGYQKLLGKGSIKSPFSVTVDKFSKLAAEKIQKAGGKITPTA
jgi:large subunit ribosomal protein L15